MEPYFMLPVSIRDRLSELSGAELKVWLCYRSHANASGVAWPGRELLHEETGLSHDTISSARAGLGRKRWLIPAQADRNSRPSSGKFGSPRFSAVIPEAKAVTDGNRDDKTTARGEPVTEYQRDEKSQVNRDREMPFNRDGESQVDRDGKTPSLSITNEVFPKELFPREGEGPALRASASVTSVTSAPPVDQDEDGEIPEWANRERPLTAREIEIERYLDNEPGGDDVPY